MQNPRLILTGGPGAGKTTVLQILKGKGFVCMPELARKVIQQRLAQGLSPRPSPEEFAAQILAADGAQYDACPNVGGPIFFDRGIPDALGMLFDCSRITIEAAKQHIYQRPYNTRAFYFPAWEAIFTTDAERDQSFAESLAISERVRSWYEDLGYELIAVPIASPEARADFILELTKQS